MHAEDKSLRGEPREVENGRADMERDGRMPCTGDHVRIVKSSHNMAAGHSIVTAVPLYEGNGGISCLFIVPRAEEMILKPSRIGLSPWQTFGFTLCHISYRSWFLFRGGSGTQKSQARLLLQRTDGRDADSRRVHVRLCRAPCHKDCVLPQAPERP